MFRRRQSAFNNVILVRVVMNTYPVWNFRELVHIFNNLTLVLLLETFILYLTMY